MYYILMKHNCHKRAVYPLYFLQVSLSCRVRAHLYTHAKVYTTQIPFPKAFIPTNRITVDAAVRFTSVSPVHQPHFNAVKKRHNFPSSTRPRCVENQSAT